MTPSRRSVIAGLAALTAAGRASSGTVRTALDEAAALSPAAALARLAKVIATAPGDRLDLAAVRSGFTIDAALARFPPRAEQRRVLATLRDGGTPGAVRLPDGGAYLLLELRRSLGDGVTIAAAEQRLAVERRRLETRARRLFEALGMTPGTTGERFSALWRDERYLYADSEAGRAAAVADMNATLDILRPQVRTACGFPPPPCVVRALTAEETAAGKSGFRTLPAAGTPGVYAVDLKDILRRPRWSLPSVVAHELLPGHLLQLPVEAMAPPHGLRATYANSFVEGWAVYAETVAAGWGAFADPHAMLGHLHWLLFRVARAQADLRLHAHGWTLAQARADLTAVMGEPAYFAAFDTDLARIAVEPGSVAGHALAWLGIADRARRHRDPAAFHRAVLADGRKRLEQLP